MNATISNASILHIFTLATGLITEWTKFDAATVVSSNPSRSARYDSNTKLEA